MIKEKQHAYYQALETADEQANSTVFVHFMLAAIADTLKKDVRTIARALAKLQAAHMIQRIGSDKSGYWKVVD